MRGGAPLNWLKPLTPEGTRAPGVRGTYRGNFEHWNLEHVRPGFVPRLVHKKKIPSRQRRGYVIAKPEDAKPYGDIPTSQQTGVGTALQTENLVLMLAPIAVVEREQAQQREMNRQLTSQPIAEYLSKRGASESEFAAISKKPIRFETD